MKKRNHKPVINKILTNASSVVSHNEQRARIARVCGQNNQVEMLPIPTIRHYKLDCVSQLSKSSFFSKVFCFCIFGMHFTCINREGCQTEKSLTNLS